MIAITETHIFGQTLWRTWFSVGKGCVQRNNDGEWHCNLIFRLLNYQYIKAISSDTVETPYNTAPYITGSNIARLGHGSQNSGSKLWIPIVKSAPVRVIFTWKSVPKKIIHGSSDIYLRTQIQWKQAVARLPVVLPFRCHCHLPLLWHNKHYCPASRTTLVATRFRVAVICPIIQVPHCIRVFFYFVWFVFINHIFQFYNELCTYCNILDIYLS